jgi:hypothetical protein
MKYTRLALAGLMLASALPLHAQVQRAQAGPATPVEKPEPKCVCDQASFKPLTEKARAVAAYWEARREYKSASTVAGIAALYAILAHDGGTMNEAQNTLSNAEQKLYPLRMKAEQLGGIKLTGGDDKTVEIKLEKGVDYTLAP